MAYRSAITAILLLSSVANNANSNGVPQVEDMCVQPGEQSAERRRPGVPIERYQLPTCSADVNEEKKATPWETPI